MARHHLAGALGVLLVSALVGFESYAEPSFFEQERSSLIFGRTKPEPQPHAIVDRVLELDLPPIGGGPPVTRMDLVWPSEAREKLVQERCAVHKACGSDEATCLSTERARVEAIPIAGCNGVVIAPCLQRIRSSGCSGLSWPLPQECAAPRMCMGRRTPE
jgi:hypothetical protein